MSDRSSFWKNHTQWPNDSEDYLFLARALDRLGRSMFPGTWTGTELGTETFKFADYVGCDDRFANNLLAEHQLDSGRQIIHARQGSNVLKGERGEGDPTGSAVTDLIDAIQRNHGLNVALSQGEMATALEIARKIDAQNATTIQRAVSVRASFAMLAHEGRLTTAYRSLATTSDVQIPPVWWDTDKTELRFYCGQLNPKNPFGDERVGGAWIFVCRKSLEQVTSMDSRSGLTAEMSPASYSAAAAEKIFKQWRDQRGADIPSEREDTAYMKQFRVGRETVRAFRKQVPRLPRGRQGQLKREAKTSG